MEGELLFWRCLGNCEVAHSSVDDPKNVLEWAALVSSSGLFFKKIWREMGNMWEGARKAGGMK